MNEKQKKTLSQWNQLNKRQQTYLSLIYELDQEAEQVQKLRFLNGGDREPAAIWRWILYGDVNGAMHSRLKSRLLAAKLVDQGTGSTFESLEQRRLIECRGEVPILEVKMTRSGRQVVRAGTHEPVVRKTRTPEGMLSEKAWEALTLAYWAGKSGLPHEQNYRYRKGIHLAVWEHLRHHAPPLVKEGTQKLTVTLCGALFYIRNYERYQAVYPNVETLAPTKTEADIMSWLKSTERTAPLLAEVKRWGRSWEETATEIHALLPAEALMRFENGQNVLAEQREQILNWLSQ